MKEIYNYINYGTMVPFENYLAPKGEKKRVPTPLMTPRNDPWTRAH